MSMDEQWLQWASADLSALQLQRCVQRLRESPQPAELNSISKEEFDECLQRLMHAPQSLSLPRSARFNAERFCEAQTWQQAHLQHHLITLASADYPSLLKHIADPPLVLFVKGQRDCLALPMLAMVGSRKASRYSCQISHEFGKELASLGLVISSGLAAGIDIHAHQGALSAKGKTVAVLGTGVEQCYPKAHRHMAAEIAEQGALISEFWPQTPPYRGNFPKRNRILSGLSMGTLVIEATIRSGSMITARLAAEQGREVFAVPGGILSGQSQGCHHLLKNGAKLVENIADIIDELSALLHRYSLNLAVSSEKVQKNDNNSSNSLPERSLLASVSDEITSIDDMVAHSGQPIDVVLEQLLELELQGCVAAVPGGYVRLKRS